VTLLAFAAERRAAATRLLGARTALSSKPAARRGRMTGQTGGRSTIS